MIASLCRFAAVLAIVALPAAAAAQIIPPSDRPGRERERFVEPPPARAVISEGVIRLPSTVAPAGADKVRLIVRRFEIVGSTVYQPSDFAPLYADLLDRGISLQAIYDLAQAITAKYGNDGYVLSRATIPPQHLDSRGAVVRIRIVEGYIDKVEWPQRLGAYRDFFTDYAAKIVAQRPANIATMERYLLLANDLPGLKFKSTLRPSKTNPAASTLVVEVTEKPIDVLLRTDNRGTKARGPEQYFGSFTVNNPFGGHDAFTATAAGAYRVRELQYYQGTYRRVLNSEGLTAFIDGSYSFGRPGTLELQTLDYRTVSSLVQFGFSYPFIRSRERNLTLTGLFFASEDDGDIFAAPNSRDRLRGFRARVDFDQADSWRGINLINVTLSQGIEGLGSTRNGNPVASRANGRVDFTKIEATYSRLQTLPANFSLLLAAYGQYAFDPLLVSEQCGYGGRYFGRAFDPSDLLGDHCVESLGELRYDLPFKAPTLTMAQLYGFMDYGKVFNIAPVLGTPKDADGASVGGGFRWGWLNYVTADISAAKGVEGFRDDWRFFFILAARM